MAGWGVGVYVRALPEWGGSTAVRSGEERAAPRQAVGRRGVWNGRRVGAASGVTGAGKAPSRPESARPARIPSRIEAGGAFEESAKGNASIAVLFPLMVIIMLTLLMVQLQSFSRLVLVFLTAPLGIVGASLGLNVANAPFGFVALLGLIALAGMIMRNAVILVDQIETDVSHGLTRREAIVEATVLRARPEVLTALAAILAMMTRSRSAVWGAMGIDLIGTRVL